MHVIFNFLYRAAENSLDTLSFLSGNCWKIVFGRVLRQFKFNIMYGVYKLYASYTGFHQKIQVHYLL